MELIDLARNRKPEILSVIELGSQNLYRAGDDPNRPPFASTFYESLGIVYQCIDMAGDNGAIQTDLSKVMSLDSEFKFDLVTDFGTSEHVVTGVEMKNHFFENVNINSMYPVRKPTTKEIKEGFYNCWKNKHNLLKLNGFMISVNPKTKNWPEHGYTYLTINFYRQLAELMGYEIIWLNEHEAMGNPNAVNIECVLRKVVDNEFCDIDDFQLCEQFLS